jgi:hypothetical protein
MVESKSDNKTIKNPFTCKSSVGVRIALDKDPRDHKENFSIEEYESANGNKHFYSETNNKINFTFGTAPETDKEYTTRDKFDFQVPVEIINKTAKVKHKSPLPLSFIQIRTEEEGIEWYKNNYPKIPDDLLPIIARYHWGEPITKKAIKNEKKKIEKKLKKQGLSVERKKVSISFD